VDAGFRAGLCAAFCVADQETAATTIAPAQIATLIVGLGNFIYGLQASLPIWFARTKSVRGLPIHATLISLDFSATPRPNTRREAATLVLLLLSVYEIR
jgi:hypothetical protein